MICLTRSVSIISLILILSLLAPLLLAFPQRSNSDFLHQRILRSKGTQKIQKCGRALRDLIQLVCSGNAPAKRSHLEESWTSQESGSWPGDMFRASNGREESDLDSGDFLDSKTAYSLFGTSNKRSGAGEDSQLFFRSSRGPVDECCYKSCSLDELRTYCHPSGR